MIIDILIENGVKLIALRCAGYNNVDINNIKLTNITDEYIDANDELTLLAQVLEKDKYFRLKLVYNNDLLIFSFLENSLFFILLSSFRFPFAFVMCIIPILCGLVNEICSIRI